MLYKRISRTLKNYKLVPADQDIQKFIDEKPTLDYYESIYLYNEEQKKQYDALGTVSGITGLVTNRIVFDIDADNIKTAQTDAVKLTTKLTQEGVPENQIQVYFSGSKGFHIELNLNEFLSKKEVMNIIKTVGNGIGSLDTKILDENRLLRIPLTKHQKSGLFKIPLTVNDLKNTEVNQIVEMAKVENVNENLDNHFDLLNTWYPIETPAFVNKLKVVKEEPKIENDAPLSDKPDFSQKPKHLSMAKFALLEGFFEKGERHEAYMILASTFRSLGYSDEITYNMLKATNRLQTRRTGQESFSVEELWNNIVSFVYSPRWKGGNYSDKENALLQKTMKKYNIVEASHSDLMPLNRVTEVFQKFAQEIDQNTIKLGIDLIDDNVRVTTSMLVTLLAAPSAGKSSISFGVLNAISRSGQKALFFSLDMGAPLVYQRLLQRHTGYDADKIFEDFKTKSPEVKNYTSILSKEYENIKFCFKSGIGVDDIREMLIAERNATGEVPKLIVIDYLENIQSGNSDPTVSKGIIAVKLKDLANDFGICVLLLVQPRLMAGGPAGELNSYTDIKGSSVLGEASSIVFTMYRPGFSPKTPENDKYLTISVVKNRMGKLGQFDFAWDGLRGEITELDEYEKQELEEFRGRVKAEKSKDIF